MENENCKMAVLDDNPEKIKAGGFVYTICAISGINKKVHCSGDDAEKRRCPFWNNMLGEKR